jgi:TRAP-type C4-dicarboxylate transport system permease small subunit
MQAQRVRRLVQPDCPMAAYSKPSESTVLAARVLHVARAMARTLLGLVLLGMVVLNVANAVGRYAFGKVFIGADESMVFAMIWLVMIAMILVTADRGHIALDFLVNRVGARARTALSLLHNAIVLVACTYAAVVSLAFVGRVGATGQTSMALGISMVLPHSALFVGFGGTAIVSLLLLISDILAMMSSDDAAGKPGR